VERDALEVYAAVRPSGRERALPARLPELSATLLPHQRRAAAWMLDREARAPAVRACNISRPDTAAAPPDNAAWNVNRWQCWRAVDAAAPEVT
jgi:hypothetical protein